jgi:hypothetical protein
MMKNRKNGDPKMKKFDAKLLERFEKALMHLCLNL